MNNSTRKSFRIAVGFFGLFVGLIIVLQRVNVLAIGPQQSRVGLADLNEIVFKFFGVNLQWYYITDWLGLVAVLAAAGFALLGIMQLIKRKSLAKVDKDIIALGLFYIIVISFYVVFEIWVINYRPIILNGILEPSFPSSHTMIVLFIMGSAILQFRLRIKEKVIQKVLCGLAEIIIFITIVGRQISGVHWFTDILGGILLGVSLLYAYKGVLLKTGIWRETNENIQ